MITIVVPIYNEEESIPHVLPSLAERCLERGWTLVLVDDGSTDQSPQMIDAFQEQALVIHHQTNLGYGAALKSGFSKAETEYVLTFDADGQHELSEIDLMLEKAIEGGADLVVGSRSPGPSEKIFRTLGKWIIRKLAGFLLTLPIKDLNSGFKLFRTALVKKYMVLCPDSMAFSDTITLVFISRHHRVVEKEIVAHERLAGKSTINAMTAFDTLVNILNIAMMFNPLRFFIPIAIIFISIGLLWGVPIAIMGRGVSVGSFLSIAIGMVFFAIGLIAHQLSTLRWQVVELQNEKRENRES